MLQTLLQCLHTSIVALYVSECVVQCVACCVVLQVSEARGALQEAEAERMFPTELVIKEAVRLAEQDGLVTGGLSYCHISPDGRLLHHVKACCIIFLQGCASVTTTLSAQHCSCQHHSSLLHQMFVGEYVCGDMHVKVAACILR